MVNIESVISADTKAVEAQPSINSIASDAEPCERQPDNGADFMLK